MRAGEPRTDAPYEAMLRQLVREQRRTRIALWVVVITVAVLIGLQIWSVLHPRG